MALAIVETERRLPYAPGDLCALVGDIRSYPHFIPWLKKLDVLSERKMGETLVSLARAEVGWHALAEKFTTEVRAGINTIDVALVEGPFKKLENRWRFSETAEGALIRFYVAYEFRNPFLQAVAAFNGDLAAARIMQAFEGEAKRRFGAKA